MTRLRSALWLPIFDDLAEPAVVARLAAEAEEAGWHGVFVWDHLRWRASVRRGGRPVDHAPLLTARSSSSHALGLYAHLNASAQSPAIRGSPCTTARSCR